MGQGSSLEVKLEKGQETGKYDFSNIYPELQASSSSFSFSSTTSTHSLSDIFSITETNNNSASPRQNSDEIPPDVLIFNFLFSKSFFSSEYSSRLPPSLTSLKLSYNSLPSFSLPSSVSTLWPNLTKLSLAHNSLTSIPAELCTLNSLQDLSLSNNKLSSLPETFSSLNSLLKLDLSSNEFTTLPYSIFSVLCSESLSHINMDTNHLKNIDKDILNWKKLEWLSINENEIDLSQIPKELYDEMEETLENKSKRVKLSFHSQNEIEKIVDRLFLGPLTGTNISVLKRRKIKYILCLNNIIHPTIKKYNLFDNSKYLSLNLSEPSREQVQVGIDIDNEKNDNNSKILKIEDSEKEDNDNDSDEEIYIKTIISFDDVPSANLLKHLNNCIAFIDYARTHGNVLVHCSAGVSRSGSIVIGYMMYRYGMNLQESVRYVKSKRPVVNPNSGFIRQLKFWSSSQFKFTGPAYEQSVESILLESEEKYKQTNQPLESFTLNLSCLQFSSIPELLLSDSHSLLHSHVTDLVLAENQLTSIPDSLFTQGFKSLTSLYLNFNNLSSLPDSISILSPTLTTLHLRHNQFTSLPFCISSLTSLKNLFLTSNQIETIPNWISELKQLQLLEIHFNCISEEEFERIENVIPNVKILYNPHSQNFIDKK